MATAPKSSAANPADYRTADEEEEANETQGELFPGTDADASAADDDEVTENEDGSATYKPNKKKDIGAGQSAHFDNLVGTSALPDDKANAITVKLMELIEKDKSEQEKRDQLYAKGLKQTGITEDAPGGADFPGASRATHPIIAECCVDSAASLYKEMFPADGPCKIKIVGDKPDEKVLDRAERVKAFMNYQLTDEIEEYEEELDQTISQVPLAGSQFMKWYWDPDLNRPGCEYVPQDKCYLPYSEQGFYSARRKTHHFNLSQVDYDSRVASGLYADIPYSEPNDTDQSQTEKVIDKEQGQSKNNSTGLDSDLELYESYVLWDVEEDGVRPYIITLRVQDNVMVGCRRNWEEDDKRCRAMDWMIEYPFIRWRGGLTLGFMHLIGGLGVAATGALRALLDSAFVNNTPSALKLKGARFGGQTQMVNPVGINEVEASPGVRDIRQLIMAFPFNPPSPTLFSLLGFLVDAGKGVVTTAEEKIADASNQMPMGTALALIEQGGKVFSAIHKRMHKAQKRSLKVLYRLNRMYLTEERVIEDLGMLAVRPEDFAGPCPIIPVSDPNIFSDAQRFSQMQGVMQLNQMFPGKYNVDEINSRALNLLKIPDPDGLLIPSPKPQDLNPVAENMAMALGRPASAFPLQDHLAHIQAHLTFFQDPSFGQNPLITPQYIGPFVEHIKQHLVMLYAKMCYDAATAANNGEPIDKLIKNDTDHRQAFDKLMATVSVLVGKQSGEVLKGVLPILQQAAQMADKMRPPAPMDPTAVAAKQVDVEAQKNQADNQAKILDIQTGKELDMAKLQSGQQSDAAKTASDQQTTQFKEASALKKEQLRQAAEDRRQQEQIAFDANVAANNQRIEQQRIEAENMRNEQDNQVATNIAVARSLEKSQDVGSLSSGKGVTDPAP